MWIVARCHDLSYLCRVCVVELRAAKTVPALMIVGALHRIVVEVFALRARFRDALAVGAPLCVSSGSAMP